MAGLQMIVFVIVFSGLVASELSKGTLVNMLTKGLKRKTVILSKFTATTTIWTIAYAICFGVTYGYTLFLLPGELPNILFAALGMWLFGVLMIMVMLLGGVLFANLYGALLVTGGFAALLMLLHIIPSLQSYNPYKLASENLALLTGSVNTTSFYMAMFVTVCCRDCFYGSPLHYLIKNSYSKIIKAKVMFILRIRLTKGLWNDTHKGIRREIFISWTAT